eukprot:3685663-Alexandrium_andersonii.AAC.1
MARADRICVRHLGPERTIRPAPDQGRAGPAAAAPLHPGKRRRRRAAQTRALAARCSQAALVEFDE